MNHKRHPRSPQRCRPEYYRWQQPGTVVLVTFCVGPPSGRPDNTDILGREVEICATLRNY